METKSFLRRAAVALAAFTMLGTLSATGQASAAPEEPVRVNEVIENKAPVPANGKVNCFGYVGTFKQGTLVWVVDWTYGGKECFGIAPDRTIWHTWPGAGQWYPMPGNGRGDLVADTREWTDGSRGVMVWVASSNTYWCQKYFQSGGWWGSWYQCVGF